VRLSWLFSVLNSIQEELATVIQLPVLPYISDFSKELLFHDMENIPHKKLSYIEE